MNQTNYFMNKYNLRLIRKDNLLANQDYYFASFSDRDQDYSEFQIVDPPDNLPWYSCFDS